MDTEVEADTVDGAEVADVDEGGEVRTMVMSACAFLLFFVLGKNLHRFGSLSKFVSPVGGGRVSQEVLTLK